MIRISIVTITYNAARTLQRTLDSVCRQTYPHIEHLIIDGASKDDTLRIAQQYKATSPHEVIIQSEPDNGLYDAMNKGLQKATGDYIVFLNAGDSLYAPDTIQTVVNAASPQSSAVSPQHLPAVVYGDTAITDGEGRFLHLRRHRPPKLLTWRSFKKGMLVCHQAFYARTDFAIATPYDLRFRYSADVDWCIRIMKAAAKERVPLQNLHMVVANYTEEGQTTLHHRESLKERYQVMSRHYGPVSTFLMHCWFVVRSVFK
jgi:glycosyltransferase involved in cell wall biosynthesis